MERRIIALQEDFSKESNKKQSSKEKAKIVVQQNFNEPDPFLFEELQKKIIENAQLTSVVNSFISLRVSLDRFRFSSRSMTRTRNWTFNRAGLMN